MFVKEMKIDRVLVEGQEQSCDRSLSNKSLPISALMIAASIICYTASVRHSSKKLLPSDVMQHVEDISRFLTLEIRSWKEDPCDIQFRFGSS